MSEDDIKRCMQFKDKLVDMLKDVRDASMCIIPLNAYDKKNISDGLNDLDAFIEQLQEADNLRELNQYIDINDYLKNSDHIERMLTPYENDKFNRFMSSIQCLASNNDE